MKSRAVERQIAQALTSSGVAWVKIDRTKRGHFRALLENGRQAIFASTPGDRRSFHNSVRDAVRVSR